MLSICSHHISEISVGVPVELCSKALLEDVNHAPGMVFGSTHMHNKRERVCGLLPRQKRPRSDAKPLTHSMGGCM